METERICEQHRRLIAIQVVNNQFVLIVRIVELDLAGTIARAFRAIRADRHPHRLFTGFHELELLSGAVMQLELKLVCDLSFWKIDPTGLPQPSPVTRV